MSLEGRSMKKPIKMMAKMTLSRAPSLTGIWMVAKLRWSCLLAAAACPHVLVRDPCCQINSFQFKLEYKSYRCIQILNFDIVVNSEPSYLFTQFGANIRHSQTLLVHWRSLSALDHVSIFFKHIKYSFYSKNKLLNSGVH